MQSNFFDYSAYIRDLEYLVNIDSGSYCPKGTAKVAEYFQHKFSSLGWQVKVHNFNSAIGPCLEITNSDKKPYDVLLMGHMDTVFKEGTVKERPFTIKDGKAYGPGANDMKAGLLYIYYALNSLQQQGRLAGTSICVALNSDEEISSKFSRPWLESLSPQSKYVLVLEAARANGNLVNKRKGVGRYKVEFTGVAAHSGVDHEKGRSAVEELAHWIIALHSKTNYETGTTVNVGLVSGGSAVNVVAEQAKAEIDVRMYDIAEAEAIEKLMHELAATPQIAGVSTKLTGSVTRPPMIPSVKTLKLCREVEKLGEKIGVTVGWTATGGGSDGSFAAILGVPTIDGLGPVGSGSHGPNEYLVLDSIEPRFQLLCQILQHIVIK